jgi:hypothetical protein
LYSFTNILIILLISNIDVRLLIETITKSTYI